MVPRTYYLVYSTGTWYDNITWYEYQVMCQVGSTLYRLSTAVAVDEQMGDLIAICVIYTCVWKVAHFLHSSARRGRDVIYLFMCVESCTISSLLFLLPCPFLRFLSPPAALNTMPISSCPSCCFVRAAATCPPEYVCVPSTNLYDLLAPFASCFVSGFVLVL